VNSVSRKSGILFGVVMLVLSVTIAVETVVRKLFSISLGGVDELSGYAVALGAPLAFTVALVERSHIRINILHMKMPQRAQAMLNGLAAVTMGALAIYLFVFTVQTVLDTHAYKSIAQTPWATPLIYPQSIWLAATGVFAFAASFLALRSIYLLARGNWTDLNRSFQPSSVVDELESELDDLHRR